MTNETWWSIFTDPHHIIAELAWTLIQDVIFGFVLYKMVWKKIVYPKLHAKFDKDHGLEHDIDKHKKYSEMLIEEFGTDWNYGKVDVDYHGGWGTKKDW
jgi:hypothetical protein